MGLYTPNALQLAIVRWSRYKGDGVHRDLAIKNCQLEENPRGLGDSGPGAIRTPDFRRFPCGSLESDTIPLKWRAFVKAAS